MAISRVSHFTSGALHSFNKQLAATLTDSEPTNVLVLNKYTGRSTKYIALAAVRRAVRNLLLSGGDPATGPRALFTLSNIFTFGSRTRFISLIVRALSGDSAAILKLSAFNHGELEKFFGEHLARQIHAAIGLMSEIVAHGPLLGDAPSSGKWKLKFDKLCRKSFKIKDGEDANRQKVKVDGKLVPLADLILSRAIEKCVRLHPSTAKLPPAVPHIPSYDLIKYCDLEDVIEPRSNFDVSTEHSEEELAQYAEWCSTVRNLTACVNSLCEMIVMGNYLAAQLEILFTKVEANAKAAPVSPNQSEFDAEVRAVSCDEIASLVGNEEMLGTSPLARLASFAARSIGAGGRKTQAAKRTAEAKLTKEIAKLAKKARANIATKNAKQIAHAIADQIRAKTFAEFEAHIKGAAEIADFAPTVTLQVQLPDKEKLTLGELYSIFQVEPDSSCEAIEIEKLAAKEFLAIADELCKPYAKCIADECRSLTPSGFPLDYCLRREVIAARRRASPNQRRIEFVKELASNPISFHGIFRQCLAYFYEEYCPLYFGALAVPIMDGFLEAFGKRVSVRSMKASFDTVIRRLENAFIDQVSLGVPPCEFTYHPANQGEPHASTATSFEAHELLPLAPRVGKADICKCRAVVAPLENFMQFAVENFMRVEFATAIEARMELPMAHFAALRIAESFSRFSCFIDNPAR